MYSECDFIQSFLFGIVIPDKIVNVHVPAVCPSKTLVAWACDRASKRPRKRR